MPKKEKRREPEYFTSATNNKVLNYNVYKPKPLEGLLYNLGIIIVGGLIGEIFYGGLFRAADGTPTFATTVSNIVVFIVVGLIARKMFVPAIIESLKNKRIKNLKIQFRDFLESLSNSLSGGMNITSALENSYSDIVSQYTEDSYMAKEISEMLVGLKNNIAIEASIMNFGIRSTIEDVENFATVFEVAYRTGGNIGDIVRRTTEVISDKMIVAEEIQTKLSSNKIQMRAMNIIPVFIILMMRSSSTDFDMAFSSVIGVVCITIGVGFFVLAYKMGEKIMDIKG